MYSTICIYKINAFTVHYLNKHSSAQVYMTVQYANMDHLLGVVNVHVRELVGMVVVIAIHVVGVVIEVLKVVGGNAFDTGPVQNNIMTFWQRYIYKVIVD